MTSATRRAGSVTVILSLRQLAVEVGLELTVGARQGVARGAEEAGDEVHLLVVALLLLGCQWRDEELIRGERAVDKRGMDPSHQLGVGG